MPVTGFDRCAAFACLLIILVLSMNPASAREVWLMTYGTGDLVEERFGHNALWLRDPARGVDEIYNFGFSISISRIFTETTCSVE